MKILEELDIIPKRLSLYEKAFIHTSYANEENVDSYERLEYLGDAVLELIMSEYLYNNTEFEEGMMTKLRAHYVCENALYEYSIKLGLNEYIRLGKGESDSGGKFRKTIVADVFESFMGALFLDQGIEVVKKFMYKHIIPLIEKKEIDFFSDYKSILQELVQTDRRSLEYVIVEESGPSHDKTFKIQVKIDNIIYGEGIAHSKKQAEQEAAKNALKKSQNGIKH
jgi:ribonuclease-3